MEKVRCKTRAERWNDYWSDIIRPAVIGRDNNKCVICGSKNNLEVDHITPEVDLEEEYGRKYYELYFYQTLCTSCHKEKTREENKERSRVKNEQIRRLKNKKGPFYLSDYI